MEAEPPKPSLSRNSNVPHTGGEGQRDGDTMRAAPSRGPLPVLDRGSTLCRGAVVDDRLDLVDPAELHRTTWWTGTRVPPTTTPMHSTSGRRRSGRYR